MAESIRGTPTPSPRPTYEELVEALTSANAALGLAHMTTGSIFIGTILNENAAILTRCRQGGGHEGNKI